MKSKKINLELIFWIAALTALFFSDPEQHHFTLCPLANLGFEWCPGCGLGRAISFVLHGEFRAGFEQHWLGVPALMIIVFRIYTLAVNKKESYKKAFTLIK